MTGTRTQVSETFRGFFGLSRMTHSVLDVAHPALGAVLVLGGAPRPLTIALGLLAAFAGYTAVFALNDLLDRKVDREKIEKCRETRACFDLDSVGRRHPLAQGSLSFTASLAWVVSWGLLSLVIAYFLNPLCPVFMIGAVGLETLYCRLLRVTHWKAVLSGLMVAVGGCAGIYAVNPSPPAAPLVLFLLWAFAWEVGCRNIPNDWTDLDEDTSLGIRTFPVRYGRGISSRVSFALVCCTAALSLLFPLVVTMRYSLIYEVGALAAGLFLLLAPGVRWLRAQTPESAFALFNRACFYPLTVFVIAAFLTIV
jgi:4-hydroxybenzoate polyprenyltransferase